MGKTRDTGFLGNCVFTDSSNNVGIGAAASGSYKLQVTGTTNLTGALSGTSATFSGTSLLATLGGNAGVGVTTVLTPNSRTHTFQIGSNNAGVSSELVLGHQGDGFSIYTSGGSGAGALTIAQGTASMLNFAITGAATFSSSVNAARMVVGGSATSRILQVNTGDQDGIRIVSSGNAPVLDLMQTAAANAGARNWRIITNWEGWGTLDFQSGTNNTNDPSTTRMSISGTTGAATFTSSVTASSFNTSSKSNITQNSGTVPAGTATTIFTKSGSNGGGFVLVTGRTAAGDWFFDTVAFNNDNSANAISSNNGGGPPSRTYSVSGSSLRVTVSTALSSFYCFGLSASY